MRQFPGNDYAGLGANVVTQAGVLGVLGGFKLGLTAFSPLSFGMTVASHVIEQQAQADLARYDATIRGATIALPPPGHGFIGTSTANTLTDYERGGRWLSSMWDN
jgi:hypothetical protein